MTRAARVVNPYMERGDVRGRGRCRRIPGSAADKICPNRPAPFVRICFRRGNDAFAWVQSSIESKTLLVLIPSFIFHRRRACQVYFPMLTARGSSNIRWCTPIAPSTICRSASRASCATSPPR
ncbi:hypothetical protein F01_410140 [Burkholderia cenocepacia]|nr:hypothetical protein F01_410140 [Burkholderia cenocepacia]